MKKIFLILILFSVSLKLSAQEVDTLQGNITSTVTLTNNKIWILKGFVYVKQGGTLNIPAGTIIYGQKSTKGTLIIELGGKIYAQGSMSQPIIFTSNQPPGQRLIGDWGGIVICGRARINTVSGTDTSAIIEGSIGSLYGGTNDNDNSGVIRYVRLEYPGINISGQSGNELNGLTMGGVGSGTVIEYVQISYGFDDGFEWFGGTVNCKYLITYKCYDDDFDVDNGYRGKIQFGLVIRDKNLADQSGSHGIESDNNANTPNNFNPPRTQPIFSNFTFIGPKQDTNTSVDPNFKRGYHLRRNSLTSVYNSIVMGWPDGILFDGSGVTCAAQNDTMQHRNNIFSGNPGGFKSTNTGCNFNASNWITTSGFSNRLFSVNSQVQLTAPYGDSITFSAIPLSGSPALTGADFTNPNLSGMDVVNYVGAFGTSNWTAGWTSWTPQSNAYVIGIKQISSEIPASFSLEQNYPNPFNPSTKIKFSLPVSGNVLMKIFNALGSEIKTLINSSLKAGSYETDFNAANLSSGIYFYRIQITPSEKDNDAWVQTKKMTLIK